MKRKFITVEIKERKRKLYLDDLTKIHQIIKKNRPKIPKFQYQIANTLTKEDQK